MDIAIAFFGVLEKLAGWHVTRALPIWERF